jgi:hypothetical protein
LEVKIIKLRQEPWTEMVEKAIGKAVEEQLQRKKEMAFLCANSSCSKPRRGSDATDMESDSDNQDSKTDLKQFNTTPGSSSADFLSEGKAIHVTAQNLGQISKLKLIKHEKPKKLFAYPALRQYFVDGILHRQEEELRVSPVDIFVDLIFVGAVSKAGHYIHDSPTWSSFFKAFSIIYLLLNIWTKLTVMNNHFYHEELSKKVSCCL